MSEEVEVRYVNGEYIRVRDYIPPKRGRYDSDRGWKTKRNFASGRLCLQAYSPYPRAQWTKRWQETRNHGLDSQIKTIIKELDQAVVDIARLFEEGERQTAIERKRWEEQQEQWRREEERRQAAEALKSSREELFRIIDKWAESNRIEKFFHDAEQRACNMSDDERSKILERLKRARELVGSTDALDHFMNWRLPDER
jgi:ribosomal protein S20